MTPGGAWLPSWKPHPATHASPVWTVVLRHLLSALGFPPADKWISIPERFCLLCLSNATMWHDECKPPMGKEGLSRPGQRCICVFLMCSRCFFSHCDGIFIGIPIHPNSVFCFVPYFGTHLMTRKAPTHFISPRKYFLWCWRRESALYQCWTTSTTITGAFFVSEMCSLLLFFPFSSGKW